MMIRTKKNHKDFAEGPKHTGLSRRELLANGLMTGGMSLLLPKLLVADLMRSAMAQSAACPSPVKAAGGIFSLFANGGPTMGARFLTDSQAAVMNTNMAANYGIVGTSLVKLGPNVWVDPTSPFGAAVLAGPPGFAGGAAGWQTNVLNKLSGGAHMGPFNQDDGAGQNLGNWAGVGSFKPNTIGKDLAIGTSTTVAKFASGFNRANIRSASATNLATSFSLTPAATGLTNSNALGLAATGANNLATALGPTFNLAARKGASQLATTAGCGFFGNTALANPNYGLSLFTAAQIPAITNMFSATALATLSTAELAVLAAANRSADGTAGALMMEMGGEDYHGNSPTSIAATDFQDGRMFTMALAGTVAAAAKGAFILTANGQAIASGTQNVTVTSGGTAANATANQTLNVSAPVATGDAGGSYNVGYILFYDPNGAPPAARVTGTLNSTNGNVQVASTISSTANAVAGLYGSALAWVSGGTVPAGFVNAVTAGGVANLSTLMVI